MTVYDTTESGYASLQRMSEESLRENAEELRRCDDLIHGFMYAAAAYDPFGKVATHGREFDKYEVQEKLDEQARYCDLVKSGGAIQENRKLSAVNLEGAMEAASKQYAHDLKALYGVFPDSSTVDTKLDKARLTLERNSALKRAEIAEIELGEVRKDLLGATIIRDGEKLPEHLTLTENYNAVAGALGSLRRDFDLYRKQIDRLRGISLEGPGLKSLQRMEADLGKVRAAIGTEAFDRIVGRG